MFNKKGYQMRLLSIPSQILKALQEGGSFSFDTETTGLLWHDELVGVSFANSDIAGYIEYNPNTRSVIKQIFSLPNKKYLHKYLFDMRILNRSGINVTNIVIDTKVAYKCVYPDLEQYGLKYLAKKFLQMEMQSFKELTHRKKDITKCDKNDVFNYACADAIATYKLARLVSTKLPENYLYTCVEHPLLEPVNKMQLNGVKIVVPQCQVLLDKYTDICVKLHRQIIKDYGQINIRSPQQLGEVLKRRFEKYNLPVSKKSKNTKTDSKTLEYLYRSTKDKTLGKLLEYRKVYKVLSTYIEPFLKYKDNQDRIHTMFDTLGAASGRLSSSSPNLQNIPSKEDTYGKEVRSMFVPSKGKIFIDIDWSQIDLRVLAHISGDYNMIKAFCENKDIHNETARLCNVDRIIAKTINFATVYGKHPKALSEQFSLTLDQTTQILDTFYKQYPKIKQLKDTTRLTLWMKHYAKTMFGRKRYFDDITKFTIEKYLRAGFNHVIQGSAADIMKLFIIRLHQQVKKVRLLLTVHDEVLLECNLEDANEIRDKVKYIAETVVKLDIPLKADVKIIKRWSEK